MIVKLLFILFIIFILKIFIIKFDFHDYFNICSSILLLFFANLYVVGNSKFYLILVLITSISLIIYSYFNLNSYDNSIIIMDGIINFKGMIKNRYSLSLLMENLKEKNVSILNENVCAILQNKKLVFYLKKNDKNDIVVIVADGEIKSYGLNLINKNKKWLEKIMLKNKCSIDSIMLAFMYDSIFYIIKK